MCRVTIFDLWRINRVFDIKNLPKTLFGKLIVPFWFWQRVLVKI